MALNLIPLSIEDRGLDGLLQGLGRGIVLVDEQDLIDDLEGLVVFQLQLELAYATEVLVNKSLPLHPLTNLFELLSLLDRALPVLIFDHLSSDSRLVNLGQEVVGALNQLRELAAAEQISVLANLELGRENGPRGTLEVLLGQPLGRGLIGGLVLSQKPGSSDFLLLLDIVDLVRGLGRLSQSRCRPAKSAQSHRGDHRQRCGPTTIHSRTPFHSILPYRTAGH